MQNALLTATLYINQFEFLGFHVISILEPLDQDCMAELFDRDCTTLSLCSINQLDLTTFELLTTWMNENCDKQSIHNIVWIYRPHTTQDVDSLASSSCLEAHTIICLIVNTFM
jgi:hypothetical protein